MNAVAPISFDYEAIDAAYRDVARAAAERIRLRIHRTTADVIEIGRDLTDIKQKIGHGHFLNWVAAEFGASERLAQRFMNVAVRYGIKSVAVSDLSPAALYALAAPSTPDEVRDHVEARAAAGEAVTVAEIKRLKEQWAEERKSLRDQATASKDRAKDAQASQDAIGHHLSELQKELAALRVERDTLRYELDRRAPIPAPSALDTVESQIEALLGDWGRVSPQARQEFLRRVSNG